MRGGIGRRSLFPHPRSRRSPAGLLAPLWPGQPVQRPSPAASAAAQRIRGCWASVGGMGASPKADARDGGYRRGLLAPDLLRAAAIAGVSDPMRALATLSVEGHRVRIPDEARPPLGATPIWRSSTTAPAGSTTSGRYERSPGAAGGRGWLRRQDADPGFGSRRGATAAGFGLLAGIVRPPEMDAGSIRHALFIVVRCSNGRAVYPARRGSSGSPCRQFGLAADRAPPLGARLWLSLSERRIKQLGVPRWKRVLLLALHRYGGFVGDTMNGHSSFGVGFESGASYTSFGLPDPWVRFGRSAGGIESDGSYILELDSGVDWGQFLRVVHPCESRGRCRRGG